MLAGYWDAAPAERSKQGRAILDQALRRNLTLTEEELAAMRAILEAEYVRLPFNDWEIGSIPQRYQQLQAIEHLNTTLPELERDIPEPLSISRLQRIFVDGVGGGAHARWAWGRRIFKAF